MAHLIWELTDSAKLENAATKKQATKCWLAIIMNVTVNRGVFSYSLSRAQYSVDEIHARKIALVGIMDSNVFRDE